MEEMRKRMGAHRPSLPPAHTIDNRTHPQTQQTQRTTQICREAESAMKYDQLSDTVRNTVMKILGHMTAPESVASSCECLLPGSVALPA